MTTTTRASRFQVLAHGALHVVGRHGVERGEPLREVAGIAEVVIEALEQAGAARFAAARRSSSSRSLSTARRMRRLARSSSAAVGPLLASAVEHAIERALELLGRLAGGGGAR